MNIPVDSVLVNDSAHEITVSCGGADYIITEADFLASGISTTASADLEKLQFYANKLLCIKKSESYLSYGDLSEKKLREKLKGKFEESVIDTVCKLLVKKGYINDSSLAIRYASELAKSRLWGSKRIAQYLYTKGFSREDISEATAGIDYDTYYENLRLLVEKTAEKFNFENPKDISKFTDKLYRFGYDWDMIKSAVSDYIKE